MWVLCATELGEEDAPTRMREAAISLAAGLMVKPDYATGVVFPQSAPAPKRTLAEIYAKADEL